MHDNGTIIPCWTADYKTFNFKKQPVTQEEISVWQSMGYYQANYTGNTYDNRNPMPEWVNTVGNQFPDLKDKTYTLYRMDTLEIMPPHIDHFNRYRELFCKDKTKIRRVVVFLEDWSPGHYFEIDKRGVVNWKAGQWSMWSPETEHAASNIGVEPRYTLQITGHV